MPMVAHSGPSKSHVGSTWDLSGLAHAHSSPFKSHIDPTLAIVGYVHPEAQWAIPRPPFQRTEMPKSVIHFLHTSVPPTSYLC